jgi:hypothetical protein
MISKKIVAVGLSIVLSTLLFGEIKSKKISSNEYEVSKTSEMPSVPKPKKLKLIRNNKTQTVYDPNTKLVWQDNAEVKNNERDWDGAMEYCDTLSFSGYSDWRLPDIQELRDIVDLAKYNPAIKDGFKFICNEYPNYYWSSSVIDIGKAWIVSFDHGSSFSYDQAEGLVRCVRDNK